MISHVRHIVLSFKSAYKGLKEYKQGINHINKHERHRHATRHHKLRIMRSQRTLHLRSQNDASYAPQVSSL